MKENYDKKIKYILCGYKANGGLQIINI